MHLGETADVLPAAAEIPWVTLGIAAIAGVVLYKVGQSLFRTNRV